jgi:hypothetical protein
VEGITSSLLSSTVVVTVVFFYSLPCSWYLFLGENNHMGIEGWKALGTALPYLQNLKELVLGEKGA